MPTNEAFVNTGHDAWHSMRNARTVGFSGISKKIVGYWAPAANWDARLAIVGAAGVKARRVYGNLVAGGADQAGQITAAISAGMTPVVSYKLGGISFSAGATGSADSVASDTAAYLNSLGVPMYVVIWHEPYDDMTGPQYVALQERLVPFFATYPNLHVGTFNHGWLLDTAANTTAFKTYFSSTLIGNGSYDFLGIDSYQTGTQANPGPILPGDRIAPLMQVLNDLGVPNMPVGVGEYNGWTLAGIQSAEKFLANPNMAFFCMWDNTSGVGLQLSGSRLTAFQTTKADGRVLQ